MSYKFQVNIFYTSISRFTRHSNSTKLGRPIFATNHLHYNATKLFQFGRKKCNTFHRAKETDRVVCQKRKHSLMTSINTSRANREHVTMTKKLYI
ncbi:unnamed protein product [Rotaria magnacalcarata]